VCELVFAHRPSPHEPEVQNRQVTRRGYTICSRIHGDLQHLDLRQKEEDGSEKLAGRSFGGPRRDAGFEKAGSGIEFGQAMSWTGDNWEELGCAVNEVDDLWDQKEEQRLAEMGEDGDAGKCHA